MSDNTLRPIWTPEDYAQTVRDAAKHRGEPGEAIDVALDELRADCGLSQPAPPRRAPAAGRHRAPTVAGMRPRRALMIARWLIAIATIVLFLSVAALFIAGVHR